MDEQTIFKRLSLPDTYRVDNYAATPTNGYQYICYNTLPFARLYSIRDRARWTIEYRVVFNDKPDVLYTGYDLNELMMRVVSAHRVMGYD